MVHTNGGDLESEKSCKQRCNQKSFMELILAQPLMSRGLIVLSAQVECLSVDWACI